MSKQILLLLISKSVDGDHEAFEQLLLSQKSIIRWLIHRMTNCREDAEDIHQEVAVRVYQHLPSLKRPESFGMWLRAIVVNECNKHLASQKRCLSIETFPEWETLLVETDSDCNPFARLEKLELGHAIKSAIENLREPVRNMFHMRYNKNMRCRDIAISTGLKAGTVSVSMFRAKKLLRKKLCVGIIDA